MNDGVDASNNEIIAFRTIFYCWHRFSGKNKVETHLLICTYHGIGVLIQQSRSFKIRVSGVDVGHLNSDKILYELKGKKEKK